LAWGARGGNELGEHGGDAVGEVLSLDDVVSGGEAVDLDAIESDGQLLVLSQDNLIGGSSCVTALADAFADVEGDAASGAFHLVTKVGLAPRELSDDASDFAIELKRAAIDVELVEVILAPCVDGLSCFGASYRRVERKRCSNSERGDRQI